MTPPTPSAKELTRRLVARAAARSGAADGAAIAVQVACERTYRELSRWLGPVGSNALITRAVVQARADHPLLQAIRIGAPSEPGLDGIASLVQVHGERAVAEALGAVLEMLLGLLGRLIGDDLAVRLVDQNGPDQARDSENST